MSKMDKYKKLVDRDNFLFVLPEKIGYVANQTGDCRVRIPRGDMKVLLIKIQNYLLNDSK